MKRDPFRKLPPNQMVEDYERHQLLPGKNHDELASRFTKDLEKMISWDALSTKSSHAIKDSPNFVKVSLMDWTSDVFISTTTKLYWGESIFDVAPDLLQKFRQWENANWKYVFQLPRILSTDTYAAKDGLVNAFAKYFMLPRDKRADINYFVGMAESELRDIGLNETDIARVHMLQMWAVNGNVHKVTFWIFAYLMHKPTLLASIREEVLPGVVEDTLNVPYLVEHCPRLEAIYFEVLRLRMSSSLMRSVVQETVVGGKILRKGNNVVVPYRQLHLNADFWGPDAAEFNAERFLYDKSLSRSSSYKPFGGGQHLCPGRFLAKKLVFSFIALALSRFQISLDTRDGKEQARFPRANESKPALGTLSPIAGDEVILRVEPRLE